MPHCGCNLQSIATVREGLSKGQYVCRPKKRRQGSSKLKNISKFAQVKWKTNKKKEEGDGVLLLFLRSLIRYKIKNLMEGEESLGKPSFALTFQPRKV